MFGAALAVAVMPSLGWHWYLGIAATPLALVLLLFPVWSMSLGVGISVELCCIFWEQVISGVFLVGAFSELALTRQLVYF